MIPASATTCGGSSRRPASPPSSTSRGDDYLEIGLGGAWQWNPLDDPLLDTYSLAYSVASLINQLFGKSREPFWQQAYTNLVRWIIELHRLLPGGWVTLQDVYRCTIDAEQFGRKIGEARELADRLCPVRAVIATKDLAAHKEPLEDWAWEPVAGTEKATCRLDPGLRNRLADPNRFSAAATTSCVISRATCRRTSTRRASRRSGRP